MAGIVGHTAGVNASPPLPSTPPPLPLLSAARVPLTRAVRIRDAAGERREIQIPVERALTLYVQSRELLTLMTLGQQPELLVLGYLLNQGLVGGAHEVASVQVDWEVAAAAVTLRDRDGPADAAWRRRIARRTVTTGCGQGTVFGDLVEDAAALPPAPAGAGVVDAGALAAMLETMRTRPCVYREAGSVHGTALWRGGELLVHVEDVGRHNAVDTVAGWAAMQDLDLRAVPEALLYTTGRLTSEMVLKSARLGVAVVVSRNGVTAMGFELAERLGITLVGRASGRRWLVYTAPQRIGPARA
ncbi:MAG: formate dehydrogenase accessory sulfurtransferase FdhD [Rubrivivax sp.]|nr:formate dehydrogenase accessory sulfurtransferase FdhD [Rubrivivax sp.]